MAGKTLRFLWRHPVKASLGLALIAAALMTAAIWAGLSGEWRWTPWVLCWIPAINAVTFLTYWIDKWLSRRLGLWRVPETTLHTITFLGGTLGAMAGMKLLRHKTLKGPFRIVFWALTFVQALAIIALLLAHFRN